MIKSVGFGKVELRYVCSGVQRSLGLVLEGRWWVLKQARKALKGAVPIMP